MAIRIFTLHGADDRTFTVHKTSRREIWEKEMELFCEALVER
jgi:hypothetical protein